MKYQSVRYCQKALDAKLTFDSIKWQEGKIVCANGALIRPGDVEATFSQASLTPTFNWRGGKIKGELQLDGLRLVSRKSSFSNYTPLNSPFFELRTIVNKGELLLYDFRGNAPLFQKMEFDLDCHTYGGEWEGNIALSWGGEEASLPLFFKRGVDHTLHVQTDFKSQALPPIYNAINYFFHSDIAHWQIKNGRIEGGLDLTLCDSKPLSLKGKINIAHLHGENLSLGVVTEADACSAALDIDFTSPQGVNTELFIEEGRLSFENAGEIWKNFWWLSHLNTQICIKEGEVEHSVMRGNFMGMAGEINLDWNAPDTLMTIEFQGYAEEIATLVPTTLQPCFTTAFGHDLFSLNATLSRSGDGVELEGSLSIQDNQLKFGSLFRKGEREGLHSTSFLEKIAGQFSLFDKRFGWFHGENFPIEKFLSPFLFKDVSMEATGSISFDATFDERYLVFSYDCPQFSLESPHFHLQAEKCAPSMHCLDLKTGGHVGILPLHQARYYQKNRDLDFTPAKGVVHFENNHIYIQDIEAKWNQLALKGGVQLEIRALDDVDLHICATELMGPSSDVQKILAHFSDSIFWELPFEGVVQSSGEAFAFNYHFSPEVELVSGHLQGDFSGVLKQPHLECSGHIAYDMNEIEVDIHSSLGSCRGTIGKKISLEGEGLTMHADRNEEGVDIHQFAYGSYRGCGEVKWGGKTLIIQNFFIQDSEKLADITFSGTYDRLEKVMRGVIESCHCDFGKATSIWRPVGEIFGQGTFEWSPLNGAKAHMRAAFQNLAFGGIHFGDGQELMCTYSSTRGLTVEGLEVEITTQKGLEKYKLGRFSYDHKESRVSFDGFDFSLPPEKLSWVAELAEQLFPGMFHSTLIDWVQAIKQNEPLEGRISLEVYPENIWVCLTLKEGAYFLADQRVDLKNFLLSYDPRELNMWTQLLYKGNPYWVHLLTDSPTMSFGKVKLSEHDLSIETREGDEVLCANWKRGKEGWHIEDLYGEFHGLNMELTSCKSGLCESIDLVGRVGVDAGRVSPLLGEKWRDKLKRFAILGGYIFEGRLSIPKANPKFFSFVGQLSGSAFKIGGVELDSLSSQLSYSPGHISLSCLSVVDWAGNLAIGHADLVQQDEKWSIECDELKLAALRLSRLKSPWTKWRPKDKPFYSSFYIPAFSLKGLRATLDDFDSIKGEGSLEFTNIPKKTLFSNLLFLPTEITARIGLDLTTLVPARGTINYEIHDGKIYLNEFKEMFSDGKRSRFFLAEGMPAYIDFNGNLNMKLRMKQYNLLMKLAEFFTITVKGTLLNPTYNFSNQEE